MRVLFVLLLIAVASPVFAATVSVQAHEVVKGLGPVPQPFEETIDAYKHSYRDAPGPAPLPALRMTVQLPLVMGLGWWLSLVLPHPRRRG